MTADRFHDFAISMIGQSSVPFYSKPVQAEKLQLQQNHISPCTWSIIVFSSLLLGFK